jgi:hypothetical protein
MFAQKVQIWLGQVVRTRSQTAVWRNRHCGDNLAPKRAFTRSLHLLRYYRLRIGAVACGVFFMRWFRANRANFAWLAFFELALSFGHVHIGKLNSNLGDVAVLAHAGDGVAGANPSLPSKKPTGLADDFCAICANISLASTLVISIAPAAVPPISFGQELRWLAVAVEPERFDHFLFDARGPPQT